MNYYINSRTVKKKKNSKVVFCIVAYILVFALSFFVSFKLVASTQTDAEEIEALKGEISQLNSQLAQKEERIQSLELQINNINAAIAQKEAEEAAAAAAAAAAAQVPPARLPR